MHLLKSLFSGLIFVFSLAWICIRQVVTPTGSRGAKQHRPDRVDFERLKWDWCQARRHRYQWQEILKPCTKPYSPEMMDPRLETDARQSFISRSDVRPAGEHSRFVIQSVAKNGAIKTFGGDWWRVVFRNQNTTTAASVFDLGNGRYEAIVLLVYDGVHSIDITLDYSQCKGLKDPPMDWFMKVHCGQDRKAGGIGEDVLSNMSDYVNEKMKSDYPNRVVIKTSRYEVKDLSKVVYGLDCGYSCQSIWDGFGHWTNDGKIWNSFKTPEWQAPVVRSTSVTHRNKHSLLWIFGDSLSYYFYASQKDTALCTEAFWSCQNTYNWIYPKALYEMSQRCSDIALDIGKVKEVLLNVTLQSEMGPSSVLLINAGAHYVKNTSFKRYKEVIDGLIEVIKEHYRGMAIWKSTTAIHQQRATIMGALRRYVTGHRTLLFNAYANSAMCDAGVPLVDVHPMTASFPLRTTDGVHYKKDVSLELGKLLTDYFSL